jgi:hypothetical protein
MNFITNQNEILYKKNETGVIKNNTGMHFMHMVYILLRPNVF